MKKILFLATVLLFAVFLGGCTARATVSGGPTVQVPNSGGSKIRGIFPPNNIVVVINSTDAPVVLTIYQVQRNSFQVRLEPGQQAELPFRQFYRGRATVVASIYNPDSGVVEDTTTRSFYLTDDGGHPRVYDWVIRKSSRRVIR